MKPSYYILSIYLSSYTASFESTVLTQQLEINKEIYLYIQDMDALKA